MLPELSSYLERIDDLRGQVRDLIADLPVETLNWRPIEDPTEASSEYATNSLGVLATHVAGAEHFWIGEVLGGHPASRDREAEFTTQAADSSELAALLEKVGAETREVLSTVKEADLEGVRHARGRSIPVRWCILHVIDHTALHLGHMQLTYQLWRRGQSGPSPRWFERLHSED